MHKTIVGLSDAYIYAGNTQALDILSHLSDWYITWTEKAAETNPHAVYAGEEAGMLEVWAQLYQLTKDEKVPHPREALRRRRSVPQAEGGQGQPD